MRIVHLVIGGDVAGGQVVALQLARAARSAGHDVSFVAPSRGAFVDLAESQDFTVAIVPLRRSYQVGALLRLRRLLREQRVDVLHTHTLAGAAIPARLAARSSGAAVVAHMHAPETFRRGPAGMLLRRLDAATGTRDTVIAVSPQIAESLVRRGYDGHRIATIPNGVELPRDDRPAADVRPSLGVVPGTPLVVCVGRLDEAKGQLDLIGAAAKLATRGVDVTIVLAGEDPHGGAYATRLRTRARESGLQTSVVFAGLRSDVPALLDAASVVAIPSHSEGVSLVLLEAMAHGRPIVATSVGGTPTVVEDDVSAVLVPPRDPDALADALERLLEDPVRAAELGAAAKERVRTSYALEVATRRVLSLYPGAEPEARPHRVVVLTEIPSPYRIPLFNALAAREDVEPLILFLGERDPIHPYPFYADELEAPWRVLPGRSLVRRGRWLVFNRGVSRAIEAHRADVVVVGGWNQPAFWLAARWCRRHRRALVAWVESTARDRRSDAGPLEASKQAFLRRCTGFLVPGRASFEYLRALGVPAQKIQTAPNAVDPAIFGARAEQLRADRDALRSRLGIARATVLTVGRLESDKGIDLLIEAMRDVPADLVIVGEGSMEQALRRAAGTNVRFAGRVERDDLVEWYAAADIFVLASRSDQWGMVLNEAAFAGLPLVATDAVGAAHDLIEPGRNGARVPTESASAIAEAIGALLADAQFLAAAGRRSREIAAAFTPEAWAEGVGELAGRLRPDADLRTR